jgi:hypothetical protein
MQMPYMLRGPATIWRKNKQIKNNYIRDPEWNFPSRTQLTHRIMKENSWKIILILYDLFHGKRQRKQAFLVRMTKSRNDVLFIYLFLHFGLI